MSKYNYFDMLLYNYQIANNLIALNIRHKAQYTIQLR